MLKLFQGILVATYGRHTDRYTEMGKLIYVKYVADCSCRPLNLEYILQSTKGRRFMSVKYAKTNSPVQML
jgi:hypothetical protein